MTDREFKDIVFGQFARIAHAFSSPKRLEIIDILAQGERDVESLARQVDMPIANTSRHLQILKSVRLVESRREGVKIFYRLADDEVLRGYKQLQSIAEKRSIEVRAIVSQFFEDEDDIEGLSIEDLWRRIKEKNVVLIDVRPPEEYDKGHIQGAVSIPLSQLQDKLDEIPKDREVVAYCRGKYCVLSVKAMKVLRDAGYRTRRLQEGYPEWKEAGMPVEEL